MSIPHPENKQIQFGETDDRRPTTDDRRPTTDDRRPVDPVDQGICQW
jgi:hypothetical protein